MDGTPAAWILDGENPSSNEAPVMPREFNTP